MNNLCAKFGSYISSNNRDKQEGGGIPPPPGTECFKSPRFDRVNVYQELIESHLRYAIVVWGALSNTKVCTLQRFQDRAFDLIESSKIMNAYNRNNLNFNQLMTFNREVMNFKIFNQLCPEGLPNKFIERYALSKHSTRNMNDLHVHKMKLEPTKNSFCTLVQKP